MPTVFARILLFISAYSPMFAIMGFLYRPQFGDFAWVFFGLAILGVLGLLGFLEYEERFDNPETLEVTACCSRDEQAMSYIVSYIIPFVSASASTWEQQTAHLIFFLMIAILYVTTNMVHINPMLTLLGRRIYEVETTSGRTFTLIARRRIAAGSRISAALAGEELYVEAKR